MTNPQMSRTRTVYHRVTTSGSEFRSRCGNLWETQELYLKNYLPLLQQVRGHLRHRLSRPAESGHRCNTTCRSPFQRPGGAF